MAVPSRYHGENAIAGDLASGNIDRDEKIPNEMSNDWNEFKATLTGVNDYHDISDWDLKTCVTRFMDFVMPHTHTRRWFIYGACHAWNYAELYSWEN